MTLKRIVVNAVLPGIVLIVAGAISLWNSGIPASQPKISSSSSAMPEKKPMPLLEISALTAADFPYLFKLTKAQHIPFARGTHATLVESTQISTADGVLREAAAGETFEVLEECVEQREVHCLATDPKGAKTEIHFPSHAACCDASEEVPAGTWVDFLKLQGKEILAKRGYKKFWVSVEETDFLERATQNRMRKNTQEDQIKKAYGANLHERKRVEQEIALKQQTQEARKKQIKEEERLKRIAEAGPLPALDPKSGGACPEVLRYLKETGKNPDTVRCIASDDPVLAFYPGGEKTPTPIVYGSKTFRNQLLFGWVVGCEYSEKTPFGGTIQVKGWFFIRGGKVEQCFFDEEAFCKVGAP